MPLVYRGSPGQNAQKQGEHNEHKEEVVGLHGLVPFCPVGAVAVPCWFT